MKFNIYMFDHYDLKKGIWLYLRSHVDFNILVQMTHQCVLNLTCPLNIVNGVLIVTLKGQKYTI